MEVTKTQALFRDFLCKRCTLYANYWPPAERTQCTPIHSMVLISANNRHQIHKAPFVSKSARNQEEAEIEAAVAAALEMPVKHRRYLDHTGRAASIEAMVVSCSA